LHLRPDEVQVEAEWQGAAPPLEEIQLALTQLAEWGNLESQPDTARVSSIEDFYRARFLYRLSVGGEAVESALTTFAQALKRRAELQTVALEDISTRLEALQALAAETVPDAAKVHEVLRDLVRVFEGLADNAQAFMAGVARTIELQQADVQAVLAYKQRLIRVTALQGARRDSAIARRSGCPEREAQRTQRPFSRSPRWEVAGRTVFVCENPNVVAIAADALGKACAPLVCTDGMPAAAQRALLKQLAVAGAQLRYHGDFDWPGLGIGNCVMRDYGAQPWRYSLQDYVAAVPAIDAREPLSGAPVRPEWDAGLAEAMLTQGCAIHEEGAVRVLLADLAHAG
jgi:uncharacterized protein (TIGR02679 family)